MVNKIHKCCTVTQQRTDDTSQRPKEHLQIIHALCFRSEIFFFFSCYQSLLKWSGQTVERDEGADEIKDRRDEQRLEEGERERDDDERKEKREWWQSSGADNECNLHLDDVRQCGHLWCESDYCVCVCSLSSSWELTWTYLHIRTACTQSFL